jgi:hypothetical protein
VFFAAVHKSGFDAVDGSSTGTEVPEANEQSTVGFWR